MHHETVKRFSTSFLLWHAYAALIVAIAIAHTARKVIDGSGGLQSRLWPPLAAAMIAAGLLAAAHNKPLGPRPFWIAVAWSGIVGTVGLALFGAVLMTQESGAGILWSAAIVAIALLIAPAQVKLFQYAHRSPGLWNTPRRPAHGTDDHSRNPEPPETPP